MICKRFKTSKSVVAIIIIALALAVWGILGPISATPAKGKPSDGNQDIPVQVLFADSTGYGIESDGGGIYIDGESKVKTFVGRNMGQFLLDTNTSNKAGAGRTLHLNFSPQLLDGDGNPIGGDPDGECPDQEWPLVETLPFDSDIFPMSPVEAF